MIAWILGILFVLWIFGFLHLPLLNWTLFSISGNPFSLQSILMLALLIWVILMLPGLLRTLAIILLIFWFLSMLGIFSFIGGLPQWVLLLLLLLILFSFFK
jgi:hypothetical protein